MTIYFYKERDPYGFMSNFSRHGVELKGKHWATTEHYFQAQKFAGTEHEEAVRRTRSAADAKAMGGDRALPLRPDWEAVKDGVMREALVAKFTQHPDLRKALLSTNDEDLVEQAVNDAYWGCGADGTGRNMLGRLLMELRAELRTK